MDELAKEINARLHLRGAFDFSEIHTGHLSNLGHAGAGLHAKEVNYFKDETQSDPIVKLVSLRHKLFSFTVCKASEHIPGLNNPMNMKNQAMEKGVARVQIKRF